MHRFGVYQQAIAQRASKPNSGKGRSSPAFNSGTSRRSMDSDKSREDDGAQDSDQPMGDGSDPIGCDEAANVCLVVSAFGHSTLNGALPYEGGEQRDEVQHQTGRCLIRPDESWTLKHQG